MAIPRKKIREHIVSTAGAILNRQGCRATGIDQIVAESGVAKTTLYRHFATKEDLIVAVLDSVDEASREELRDRACAASADARERILATFDVLDDWIRDDSFFGCPFVAAAGDYPEDGAVLNPVFRAAATHKRLVIAFFEELAHAARLADAKGVAMKLQILHEGAMAVAHVTGDRQAAARAREMAALVLDAAG